MERTLKDTLLSMIKCVEFIIANDKDHGLVNQALQDRKNLIAIADLLEKEGLLDFKF